METNTNLWIGAIFNVYSLIVFIVVVIIGIILGIKNKITVYRDYNDLGLVFLLGLSPIVLMYLFSFFSKDQQVVIAFIIIIEIILLCWIIIRTYRDNKNLISTLLALVTKIPLSVLFIINLISFVTPTGKTASNRASARREGFVFLLLLTPIVFALVKNKEGLFNPERTLASRGLRT